MPSPVRSIRLLAAHAITGSVSFTGPPGYRTIIANVDWFVSTSSIGVNASVNAYGPSGQTWDYHEQGINSASSYQWSGRMCLEPGETVTFASNGAVGQTTDVSVNGWLLTLP